MRLCQCVDEQSRLIGADVNISHITADSRSVSEDGLFAAIKGTQLDGLDFIDQAIERGASALLGDDRLETRSSGLPSIIADNPRLSLARIAAKIWPAQPRVSALVTGTNGKSSTVEFLRQIWQMEGHAAASLGTLGLKSPVLTIEKSLTTPDPTILHCWLDQIANAGVDHLALEASSHGLAQYRLDGLEISAAAFTNLSRDHLDYHGGLEAYMQAKFRLFTEILPDGGTAVINADDPKSVLIREAAGKRFQLLDFGRSGSDLRLISQRPAAAGQEIGIEFNGSRFEVASSLIGSFQAMNLLAAAGLAIATGSDPGETFEFLAAVQGAKGRMQLAGRTAEGAPAFVDYAHTPDALEKALLALRPHIRGKLLVAFGCGGDRDAGKRPQMGQIASDQADLVIVTDDNPRSEDPAAIRKSVMAAAPDGVEIGDRSQAIAFGLEALRADDGLLIAGKGHEQGQIQKHRTIDFDDLSAAQDHLRRIGGSLP